MDTSRPSLRTNWTRLVFLRAGLDREARDDARGRAARARRATAAPKVKRSRQEGGGGGAAAAGAAGVPLVGGRTPPPPPRTEWTHRVPHPVLIGHASPQVGTGVVCVGRWERAEGAVRAHGAYVLADHPRMRPVAIQLALALGSSRPGANDRLAVLRHTTGGAARAEGAEGTEGAEVAEGAEGADATSPPPPPSSPLPYKVDTSRPSLRTNWTRLVHRLVELAPPARPFVFVPFRGFLSAFARVPGWAPGAGSGAPAPYAPCAREPRAPAAPARA